MYIQPRTLERVLTTTSDRSSVWGGGSFTAGLSQFVRSLVFRGVGLRPALSFLCSRVKHRADSEFRSGLLPRRPWRRTRLLFTLAKEHRLGASRFTVMTGWRCWQGSALPTTLPGLWAQSLQRKQEHHLYFRIDFATWTPKYNWTGNDLVNTYCT